MPSVPEECLWLIVNYLRHERATLHALLLTNSTFFRIAVSFLYCSPFRILEEESNWHWNIIEKTRRYDGLLHLLIHSSRLLSYIDENGRAATDLPRYGPEVPILPSPSTVDYLSYYTDMFHDPMIHQTFMTLFPTIPNCYQANVIWYRAMVETRNRIEYAMMARLLPQITSLTVAMPIQVPRIRLGSMANLRRLEVIGTEYCWLTEDDLQAAEVLPMNRTTRSSMSYRMTRLDRMLMFIWDHQRIFGTLRELKIENRPVALDDQPSVRLIELVEAMGDRLEVLEVRYWPDAILFLERIPTRHLRRLLLHLSKEPGPIFEGRENMAMFLAQCPNLEEFSMYTDERDLLAAWRPQHQRSQQHQQPATSHYNLQSTQIPTMSPIKRINIAGLAPNVIAVINEAVDLFAANLEAISARSWFSGKPVTVPLAWPGCTLSRLFELDFEGEVAWTFDYESLINCPRLCRIRLGFTGPKPKRQPEIHHLTRLATLQDLELVGNWQTLAIQGWPKVVAELYHLERLDLIGCEGITSDQVFAVVRDIIFQSHSWRLREQGRRGPAMEHGTHRESLIQRSTSIVTTTTMTTTTAVPDLFYGSCRLRWVIANRRLEDGLYRHWYSLQQMYNGSDGSSYLKKSLDRVRFSWVTTARPSR